jgi:hypothetical protein
MVQPVDAGGRPIGRSTHGCGRPEAAACGSPLRRPITPKPLHVGAVGGTIHSHPSRSTALFQVCLGGTCLLCESLHVGMAHLNRMERTLLSGLAPAAPPAD